jgi:hypothetical protein
MARISKGILGGFSGTVGTVIGGTWKGIPYMRSMPTSRKSSSIVKQKEQRLKFGIMVRFFGTITSLLNFTSRSVAIHMTGPNYALRTNLANAITGKYPDYTIDYSKVSVSRGELQNVINPVATALAGNQIDWARTDNSGAGKAAANDQSILVVFSEDRQQTVYIDGDYRSGGKSLMDVTMFTGLGVHTWIAFFSEDGRRTSPSIYTGKVTVIA